MKFDELVCHDEDNRILILRNANIYAFVNVETGDVMIRDNYFFFASHVDMFPDDDIPESIINKARDIASTYEITDEDMRSIRSPDDEGVKDLLKFQKEFEEEYRKNKFGS